MDYTKNVLNTFEGKDKYSDTKSNADNKSVKSSNTLRKNSQISPLTIFQSVEREINELIQEINVRSQKNKLISINDSLKLLSKKYISGSSTETYYLRESNEDNSNVKNDYENKKKLKELESLNKNYENEIKSLKEDNMNLQNKLNNNAVVNEYDIKIQKSQETVQKLTQKLEQTNYLYADEKTKNNHLILQIKNLEEALKSLNNEYNSLSFQYGKLQQECEAHEKTIADMKKFTYENKNKFEDLIKINSELKIKLIESENTLKLHSEDTKSTLRKNVMQQKYIEEIENKNKQILADLNYKEERLKAIRLMNTKLEQKSNQILKKFEAFKMFEQKSNEISQHSQKMLEIVEDLNKKLSQENYENENLRKHLDDLIAERDKSIFDLDEMKKQISNIKSMNDELIAKNNELENKFKRSLEQRTTTESNNNSSNISRDRNISKNYQSSVLHNINPGDSYTKKYASTYKENETTIEEMRPAKIVITNNNVEVVNK